MAAFYEFYEELHHGDDAVTKNLQSEVVSKGSLASGNMTIELSVPVSN